MQVTTWTYPWDVGRLGAESVVNDLGELGVVGVDLAATYHPVASYSPHGERPSVFFSADGGVFFPARPARYSGIQPRVCADPSVVGAWRAVAEPSRAAGLELNAWVVTLFQPWMAQDYPEAARVLPTGDRSDSGVCPNCPQVADYLVELVSDLCDQFPVKNVKLEGICPPLFSYDWAGAKVHVPLTSRQSQLLGLCFCSSCQATAKSMGIDVDRARDRLLRALGDGAEEAADPDLEAYAAIGRSAADRVVRRVVDAVAATGDGSTVFLSSPREPGGPGLDVSAIGDLLGGVILIGGDVEGEAVRRTAAWVRAAQSDGSGTPALEFAFHPPAKLADSPGLGHSAPRSWLDGPAGAAALGVGRTSIYTYGTHRPDAFARLVAIAQAAG